MNKDEFIKTYCHNCGSQRCEGIDSEWFEGCRLKWNLDGMDAAAEIKRLEDKISDLTTKLVRETKEKDMLIKIYKECALEVVKSYIDILSKNMRQPRDLNDLDLEYEFKKALKALEHPSVGKETSEAKQIIRDIERGKLPALGPSHVGLETLKYGWT